MNAWLAGLVRQWALAAGGESLWRRVCERAGVRADMPSRWWSGAEVDLPWLLRAWSEEVGMSSSAAAQRLGRAWLQEVQAQGWWVAPRDLEASGAWRAGVESLDRLHLRLKPDEGAAITGIAW